MISEALRYYSICREITRLMRPHDTILDVGCKGRGIGLIYTGRFIGVDLSFPNRTIPTMTPVIGSALQLPFPTGSFDIVVCSDVLEHIPPDLRPDAVRELLRVAGHALILGFPSGETAGQSDRFIDELYNQKRKPRPDWLTEHLDNGPVDPSQVEEVLNNENVKYSFTMNQSLTLSYRLSRIESMRFIKSITAVISHAFPSMTGFLVRRFFDKTPPYARRIYTVQK